MLVPQFVLLFFTGIVVFATHPMETTYVAMAYALWCCCKG